MTRVLVALMFIISANCAFSQTPPTSWTLIPVTPQRIASVTAFTASTNFPANTPDAVVGTITVTMNPPTPAFNSTGQGSLSITGTNSCGFYITGSTVYSSHAGCAAGTYSDWNVLASQPNTLGSPFTQPEAATAVAAATQTIASVTKFTASNQILAGSPNAVIGAVSVTMNPVTPAFTGTLSITGANACGIHLTSPTLPSTAQAGASGCTAGVVSDWNIVATQSGVTNSPFTQPEAVTAVTSTALLNGVYTITNGGVALDTNTTQAAAHSRHVQYIDGVAPSGSTTNVFPFQAPNISATDAHVASGDTMIFVINSTSSVTSVVANPGNITVPILGSAVYAPFTNVETLVGLVNVSGTPNSLTITTSAATTSPTKVHGDEYSGITAIEAGTASISHTASNATAQSIPITTTHNGAFVWGYGDTSAGMSFAGTGYTRRAFDANAKVITEDKIQGTAGATAVTFTTPSGGQFGSMFAVLAMDVSTAVPPVALAATTGNVGQQFRVSNGGANLQGNGLILASSFADGFYIRDAGGYLIPTPTPDQWAIIVSGSGYTIQDTTTGNYVNNCSGSLCLSTSTPTVWALTPVTMTSNCPTMPPPQAARAGYTFPAYCLDPAGAHANLASWFDCSMSMTWAFAGTTKPGEAVPPPPPLPPPVSPDGTTINGGSTGSIITAEGTWTFGGKASNGVDYVLLLNGSNSTNATAITATMINLSLYTLASNGQYWQRYTAPAHSTHSNGFQWYMNTTSASQFTCARNMEIAVDPTTGLSAWHYHYYSDSDPPTTAYCTSIGGYVGNCQMGTIVEASMSSAVGNGQPVCSVVWAANCGSVYYPAGSYLEVRLRSTIAPYLVGNPPPPDFYSWCLICGSIGPIERDIVEMYQGLGGAGAIHDWSTGCDPHSNATVTNSATTGVPALVTITSGYSVINGTGVQFNSTGGGITAGTTYYAVNTVIVGNPASSPNGSNFNIATTPGGTPISTTAGVVSPNPFVVAGSNTDCGGTTRANFDQGNQHSIGMMTTSDGVSLQEYSGYYDNSLWGNGNSVFVSGGYWTRNYASCPNFVQNDSVCLPTGRDETLHLTHPLYLNFWWGGTFGPDSFVCSYNTTCKNGGGQPDMDTWVESITVWTCSDYATNPSCFKTGQPTQ